MKTTYISMVIIASVLFTPTAAAKLGANRATIQTNHTVEINIEAEITNNINKMLKEIETPSIQNDVANQLSISAIKLQSNQLMQNIDKTLSEYKLKVVVAD